MARFRTAQAAFANLEWSEAEPVFPPCHDQVFTDVISGDELASDSFDLKLVDNVVYEIDSQIVTIKEGDVDIGGNPSAEEADEGLEDGAKSVNNFAHAFSLQATSFDKKSYLTYLKGYMKAVKTALVESGKESEVAEFEKNAQAFAKKLVANFKDYEFYTGESMNPDGMVALLNYREDGVTPYWTLWKHGLKEQKV
ncbi:hypothetical protein OC845_001380 [Tilletia horrida]|nr:hypothetical protein OC845_001380 [Tilletia horrida]